MLYENQGNDDQAEQLYQRVLAISEKVLGPAHLNVAFCLDNLAALYWKCGKYSQCELLYQRALSIFVQILGPTHPHVETTLENYALLLRSMKRRREAAKVERQVQKIRVGRF